MTRRSLALLLIAGLLGSLTGLPRARAQGGSPVVIRSHVGATGALVTHANALQVQIVGPDGRRADVDASNQLLVSAAVTVDTIGHVTSVLHVAAASPFPVVQSPQQGAWPVVAHAGTGSLTVNQGGVWALTAHQGGAWRLDHVTSVLHVASASPLLVQQNLATLPLPVTAHAGTGSLTVNQGGGWAVSAHQTGLWRIDHVTSVVHVGGAVGGSGAGNFVVSQGTAGSAAWPVAAHQAGVWTLAHVTSVLHVAAAGPVPVVQSPQQGPWPVTAHAGTGSLTVNQGGTWNVNVHQGAAWTVAHVTSVTHVAGIVQAGTGSGNLVCHSTAAIATAASGIIIHAAGAANRIFICGVVLVSAHVTAVSLVEGTGALCATGIAPMIGSTTGAEGLPMADYGGFSQTSPFPWIATQTAGNNVCLLIQGTGRVAGSVTYRGAP